MAKADQPVSVRILNDLTGTALLLPDGGADYYHDINLVLLAPDDVDAVTERKAILLFPEGDAPATGLNAAEPLRWQFTAVGVLTERTGTETIDLLQLAHDIHRAIKQDIHRGTLAGNYNAVDTQWEGSRTFPASEEDEQLSWVECDFSVFYRTAEADMTVAT